MKILIVDAYLTPSHGVWLDILKHAFQGDVQTLTLPPYHWKWRMHGGSIQLGQQLKDSGFQPDIILATEMIDLNVFLSHSRIREQKECKVILYFHENQLTYPVSIQDQDQRKNFDNHYAFINFSSALLADRVIFNSGFHQESFLCSLPPFLKQFPDSAMLGSIDAIRSKSSVIYPGFDHAGLMAQATDFQNDTPIILWNHRWEYDKDPDTFFGVLQQISARGLPFKLAVLGQSFQKVPPIFEKSRISSLSPQIIHWGFVKNREQYYQWLWKSDIVISTSRQDFFGISVVEAIEANCYPLLPDRLAFPEHIPEDLHSRHLYQTPADLCYKLSLLLKDWKGNKSDLTSIKSNMSKYRPDQLIGKYQDLFNEIW